MIRAVAKLSSLHPHVVRIGLVFLLIIVGIARGQADVPSVIINEVDADTPGTDAAEFIELYDGGVGNTSLDGLVVVLFNGSSDTSYGAFDLDGKATDANGYFVLGNSGVPNVGLVFGGNSLQNGADAVALFVGDASDFPNGTAVTTVNLIDAFVYDTNEADDAGLLPLLNAEQPQVNEDGGDNGSANDSNQRCPNGSGGARNTSTYAQFTPTPGSPNICVNVTPPVFTKSFAPDSILTGEVSTLTFTIDNTASAISATGLSFTDDLPDGLVIADPANATVACTGGTVTAVPGASIISYTGGAIEAGSSCTITVDVTSSTLGEYMNTTSELTSSSGNSGTATDTLDVVLPGVDLSISIVESVDPVIAGSGVGNLSYVVTVTNLGPSDASGVVVDVALTLPASVTVASTTPGVGSFVGTTWTIGHLANGASANLTVLLTASSFAVSGTDVISNTATVTGVNETDTDASNDSDSESTSIVNVPSTLVINEVDVDTPGTDTAEFIELYDGGAGHTPLGGLVVVLFNGNDDASYAAFDLDGFSTDGNGYFVLGNVAVPNVDLVISDGVLMNGPDAVALYAGNAADFPNGTAVTPVNLIDAFVYDTNDSDDVGLLVLLNSGQPQVNESGGGDVTGHSSQRCPNGSGGRRNTDTYVQSTPTPGAPSDCPDTTPPIAVCQDLTVQLDASGNASISAADVDGGSSDNVDILSLAIDVDTFDCSHAGPNAVILTVTDTSGNTATCTATVTVEDNVAPSAVAQDITVPLDASGNAAITASDVDAGSGDACGIASLSVSPNSFNCSNVGENTVTLTVMDNHGNSSTATATVTVEDNVPPAIICPADMAVDATSADGAVVNFSAPVGMDNCLNPVTLQTAGLPSGSTFPIGTTVNTFEVTDASGNTATCSFNVKVQSSNAPPVASTDTLGTKKETAVSVPSAKLLANDSDSDGGTLSITDVSASSAQGGSASLGAGQIEYTPPASFVGSDSFTYTLSDGQGGMATGTVLVTVGADGPSLNSASITMMATGKLVRFFGIPGVSYIIQYADAMDGPWFDLSPVITAGPTGIIEYEDTTDPPPSVRFYRTVTVPAAPPNL